MASASLVRQLGSLFDGGSAAGLSDRQLIERFHHRRDDAAEAAFAALVARHGPMVLGVCRQLLGDHHLAEDAFQATFLVLARKARSLRDPDRLGTWLYGVALRTARKARARLARQRIHEQGDVMDALTESAEPTAPPADQASLDRDQAEALHGEIDRLPDTFRSPIVLCYFEGLTLDEAARQLRCPAGTLRSRLARAREKLRRALDPPRRRPVDDRDGRGARLPPCLGIRLAPPVRHHRQGRAPLRGPAAAMTSTAATLAREVLRTMTIHKLKTTIATLVFVAALAAGGAISLAHSHDPGRASLPASRCADGSDGASPSRWITDPGPGPDVRRRPRARPGRQAGAERDGRRLHAAQAAVRAHRFGGDLPDPDRPRGERWLGPVPARRAPHLVVAARRVRRHARWRPATASAGPTSTPTRISRPPRSRSSPSRSSRAACSTRRAGPSRACRSRSGRSAARCLRGWARRARSASVPRDPSAGGAGSTMSRAGPTPATTDVRRPLHPARHRPRPAGQLSVLDPRFAPQTIEAATDAAGAKPLKAALQPARTVTGRVTYADTGKPAAHARVRVGGGGPGGGRFIAAETDAEGRFRVRPMASDSPLRLGRSSRWPALFRRRDELATGPRGRPSRPSTWPCPGAS